MTKFISTLFYIVFVTILVGVGGMLIGTMLPIPGNIEMKIVKSGSMEPQIPTGSVVVVKPVTTYAMNDVITFGKDTKTDIPTTHRIIGIEGSGSQTMYTTKGDANEEQDPNPVAKKEVIGKVVFHMPYAGFVLDFARQPIGFVLLIAVPAALVILEEVLAIFREATKGRRRKKDDEGGTPVGGSDEGAMRNTLDLRGAPRIIYSRFRMMDEVFVPTLEEVSESFRRRMNARYEPAPLYQGNALLARRCLDGWAGWLHGDAYGTSTALTIGLVFVSTLLAGANGGTIAYFQDIEKSMGNIFGAGARWEAEALAELEELRLLEPESFAMTALSDGPLGEAGEVLGETTSAAPPEEPPLPETPAEETIEEPSEPPVEPPAGPFGEPLEPAETHEPESTQSPVIESISEAPNEPQNEAPAEDEEPSSQILESAPE